MEVWNRQGETLNSLSVIGTIYRSKISLKLTARPTRKGIQEER